MAKKHLAISVRTIEFETMLLGAEILRFGGRKCEGKLGSLEEALLLAASLLLGQTHRNGERLIAALFRSPNLRRPSRTIRRIVGTWLAGESRKEAALRAATTTALRRERARLHADIWGSESNTPEKTVLRRHRRASRGRDYHKGAGRG